MGSVCVCAPVGDKEVGVRRDAERFFFLYYLWPFSMKPVCYLFMPVPEKNKNQGLFHSVDSLH